MTNLNFLIAAVSALFLNECRALTTKYKPFTRVTRQYSEAAGSVVANFVGGATVSGLTSGLATVFTSEQIDAILPHRYPFALVDKVVEYEAGKRAVGIKSVTKVGLLM
jgi:hypothetical protein